MLIPDADVKVIEVKVNGLLAALGMATTETVNLFHYRRTTFPNPFNHANFLDAVMTLLEPDWLDAVSASWSLVDWNARCLDDATDAGATATGGGAGSIAGDCLPGFNNMLVSKKSGMRGPSYRGRFYFCGVPESGVDGNTLAAGQLALLTTLAALLDNGFSDSDGNAYVPCVFSPSLSQVEMNPTFCYTSDVVQCEAKDPVSVLRSRKARE